MFLLPGVLSVCVWLSLQENELEDAGELAIAKVRRLCAACCLCFVRAFGLVCKRMSLATRAYWPLQMCGRTACARAVGCDGV